MQLAALVVLRPKRDAQAAALSARFIEWLVREVERVEGRLVEREGDRLYLRFNGFVRAMSVFQNVLKISASVHRPSVSIALSQAVISQGDDGSAKLSSRSMRTLEAVCSLAAPEQIIITQHLQVILKLEAPDYAELFAPLADHLSGTPLRIAAQFGAPFVFNPVKAKEAASGMTTTQSLDLARWLPQPGPERQRLMEITQRILAEVIGPLARDTTIRAAARAEKINDLVRLAIASLPREVQAKTQRRLASALHSATP